MTRIDIHEASSRFFELMERVAKGEEVIIELNDRPIARISPVATARKPRQFGGAKDIVQIADDFDEPKDFAAFTAGR